MKIIESAKSESICGSQTAHAIYFSHSHFDLQGVDTKSRKHVHGGELSISASDAIIDEHEHDVRLIGEGGLSFRLQPGISICHKWIQKMRKADIFFESTERNEA